MKKLVLAGLAAFAYYKYNKMSPQERNNMFGSIKREGQKLWDQINPSKKITPSTPLTRNYENNPVTPDYNEGPAH